MSSRGPAVVLLSGGLDSATTLAIARAEGFEAHALTVAYGQRHAVELEAAARVAAHLQAASHTVVRVDLAAFGGSVLTGEGRVPKHRTADEIGTGIPVTYVPARNTVFLSLALARAETLGTGQIFVGVNAVDYSGYPDCRPEYVAAFEAAANLATRGAVDGTLPVTINAPLIDLSKADIIRRGLQLGVDYGLTCSCYDPTPDGMACGECDACLLRRQGFADAGAVDPVAYVESGSTRA